MMSVSSITKITVAIIVSVVVLPVFAQRYPAAVAAGSPNYATQRNQMVDSLLVGHGITDEKVLAVMRTVPRHLFVSQAQQRFAYRTGNLPIGNGQVIGHPYLVAFMTQALQVKPTDTVLEIGTGSGYQAAVLSKLVKQVYSIEIYPELARSAKQRLLKLGYKNIEVKCGDGYLGWPQHAPFDAIIVTSFPGEIPKVLIDELKIGGHMVLPVIRKSSSTMNLVTRTKDGSRVKDIPPEELMLLPGDWKPAAAPSSR